MYECINGWTKAKMLAILEARPFEGAATTVHDDGRTLCSYLNEDGNRCAVGMFIPDGHKAQKNVSCVSSLLEKYPDLRKFMPLSVGHMGKLQIVHDNPLYRDTAKSRMIAWVNDNVAA